MGGVALRLLALSVSAVRAAALARAKGGEFLRSHEGAEQTDTSW